jgi:hypothetical protein
MEGKIGSNTKEVLQRHIEVGDRPLSRVNLKHTVSQRVEADDVAEVQKPQVVA